MKLDKNGYAPSIMVGFRAENEYTVRHEVFGGKNRKISKENGFWVAIYPDQHEMIHKHPNTGLDLTLKRNAQSFYEKDHTREEFIALIGKNYLGDEPSREEQKRLWEEHNSLHLGGAEKMFLAQEGTWVI